MKLRKSTTLILFVISVLFSQNITSQTYKVPKGGKKISDQLIGIFFEDLSYAADGGLYSELIQNGSFEYSPSERDGWGPGTSWRMFRPGHSTGYIDFKSENPIHENNPHYMRIIAEHVGHHSDYNGWTGVGIQNDGFDGIVLRKGNKYDFSIFTRCETGKTMEVRIVLQGERNEILDDKTLTISGSSWQKHTTTLSPSFDYDKARLSILLLTEGYIDIDMVSLMPQDTYKGHGMRKDLAEALEALHPKFVRFPGGCVVHGGGDGFWDTYRWKTTIGPKETRRGLKNSWGYHQSMGIGYYEYFQLCEDLGAEALPILPVGVSCQGAGVSWGLREQNQMCVSMDEMEEWAEDALDLIEWANGDVLSEWGSKRAMAGHPEPFNLKYIGLGNEEKITPEFEERFKYIYNKIRNTYPDIVIVGTAGPGSHKGNQDYENAWRLAEETEMPIIDEHYYERRDYFLNNQHNYDNYPRERKTKVYLGEYAMKDRDWMWMDALAEGLYLLGIERNGDVVCMTSYAPLFAKRGHTNWDPDLIYFDNKSVYLTCSYFVQQMFGMSSGDYYYEDVAIMDKEDSLQGTSAILDSKTNTLYIKLINASSTPQKASLDLRRFGKLPKTADMVYLSGAMDSRNNYDKHEISPEKGIIDINKTMSVEIDPYTFKLLKINL